jgi:hypothetical protein
LAGWFNSGEWFEGLPSANNHSIIPEVYSLEQNYPNPFNPVTTIRFDLPKVSRVNIQIYNTAGRAVAELVDGWRDAGHHELIFDGAGLASGMYVYHIEAGEFTATKKMILMK